MSAFSHAAYLHGFPPPSKDTKLLARIGPSQSGRILVNSKRLAQKKRDSLPQLNAIARTVCSESI